MRVCATSDTEDIIDTKAIIDQVVEHIGNAPEAIKDLLANPAGTIESITGQHLEGNDLSGVLDGIKEHITGSGIKLPEGLDLGALGNLAGKFDLSGITEGLGDMLGGLFGKK